MPISMLRTTGILAAREHIVYDRSSRVGQLILAARKKHVGRDCVLMA